jgi:hypothetical protein
MPKSKQVIIQVRKNDGSIIEVKIINNFINFYEKETGRSKVSAKSLSKFINHLIQSHCFQVSFTSPLNLKDIFLSDDL